MQLFSEIMRRLPGLLRVLVLLFAVGHATVPAVAVVADAVLHGRASAVAPARSDADDHAARAHQATCEFCQILSSAAAPAAAPAPPAPVSRAGGAAPVASVLLGFGASTLPRSRAPPTV